jgi:hypothetical protein
MKLIATSILTITCLFSQVAWAQCASGANAGGACVPPPDQSYSPLNPDNQVRQQPRAIWVDRWGAIVADPQGDAGHSEDQESKAVATEVALAGCKRNGAQHCRVVLTFHNQCAAVAWGDGELIPATAPSEEKAEQAAIKACGGMCKIEYSACSFAKKIQ